MPRPGNSSYRSRSRSHSPARRNHYRDRYYRDKRRSRSRTPSSSRGRSNKHNKEESRSRSKSRDIFGRDINRRDITNKDDDRKTIKQFHTASHGKLPDLERTKISSQIILCDSGQILSRAEIEGNVEMEVMRRVAEAKLLMEKKLQEEYDRKYELAVSELQMKEATERDKLQEEKQAVEGEKKVLEEAQAKLAEERLALLEQQRHLNQQKVNISKEKKRLEKLEQELILNKSKQARPKLSFNIKQKSIL
ncbi:Arginine and glutamate-rich protein 1 [Trichoplax sp. H2]|nr:Arginine and glutamate-rich protein 1 [Trichoplax sp. H2]|eukprot:RDD46016.1 Arginine and glutamate-rich protein 1 [Trichoplax sp. H2]